MTEIRSRSDVLPSLIADVFRLSQEAKEVGKDDIHRAIGYVHDQIALAMMTLDGSIRKNFQAAPRPIYTSKRKFTYRFYNYKNELSTIVIIMAISREEADKDICKLNFTFRYEVDEEAA